MLIYDVLHKEKVYQIIANDLRNYGVKYRWKKAILKTEKYQRTKNISRKIFKTPLSYQSLDIVNLSSGAIVHVPVFVIQASAFLEKYITQEGLFRKAGSRVRQKELMARLDNGGSLSEKSHAIDVANCLKTFFRDLPEPLIPYTYHDLFVHCVMLKSFHVQAILLACILLPPYHLNTLAFLMEFLQKVSFYEKQNKMSVENLAKVIGPNIMPLQEATISAVQNRLEAHLIIVKILIENAQSIGILPDRVVQALSAETVGNTDNESDVSDSQFKGHAKKKERSGSVTRKPHLSACNLNLRMFNGLKKIVGKSGSSDDISTIDSQHLSIDSLYASTGKISKKRKVAERHEPQSTKKKSDRTEKSKKIRLSLDRFVPRAKHKTSQANLEISTTAIRSCIEQRRSYICDPDSQRKPRRYSEILSHLHAIPKPGFQKDYNDIFTNADVNLSDESGDRDSPKMEKDSKTWSLERSSDFDDSLARNEEYVRIPKSEYEDIKNRVSAIESCISHEFGCIGSERDSLLMSPVTTVNGRERSSLLINSVNKVQTEYEKTLEEASIGSTMTADHLAKKLGKELKIRRSAEHKIIRSPSARKIGNLRRRSQEKVASKRLSRTQSWHVSQGSDYQLQIANRRFFDENLGDDVQRIGSVSRYSESSKSLSLSRQGSHVSSSDCERKKGFAGNRISTVNRASSFHGDETLKYLQPEKAKRLEKRENFDENIPEAYKRKLPSWKDAERYFRSPGLGNGSVPQTGRASIAKLRAQNAGMVMAKAKLFDENNSRSPPGVHHAHQSRTLKPEVTANPIAKKIPSRKSPKRKTWNESSSDDENENENRRLYKRLDDKGETENKRTSISHQNDLLAKSVKKAPVNAILQDGNISIYKNDVNLGVNTPNIKRPLTVKTVRSAKSIHKSMAEARRTPLKAVAQIGTPKQSISKDVIKARNLNRTLKN